MLIWNRPLFWIVKTLPLRRTISAFAVCVVRGKTTFELSVLLTVDNVPVNWAVLAPSTEIVRADQSLDVLEPNTLYSVVVA